MKERETQIPKSEPLSCPLCSSRKTSYFTECYDRRGKRLCDLWFCSECKVFVPVKVEFHPAQDVAEGDGANRRKEARFNTWFVIEVQMDGSGYSEPTVATVVNASTGGVFFNSPQKIEENRAGSFRISLPSAPTSFKARGTVVRCSSIGNGLYGVAINFTEVDPKYREALERYLRFSPAGLSES